jgi:general L-amino acid transport system permease protein
MNVTAQSEVLKPPRTEVGLLGWLTKNLFSTWYNVLLTIFSIAFIYVVLRAVITWVVRDARWEVVTTNLKVFMIGRYPGDEAWRVWACLGILVLLAGLTWVFWRAEGKLRRWLVMLTLVLAVVGIVASFPLGVLLALGRRSSLPGIKVLCTAYIETIRGVPLITVLFMSQLMLPLFLPPEIRLSTVMRALTGITLFSAAYTAENVRGGLASIPRGQYEAARAVGLNEVLVMVLIVLPQALRAMIPAIVGQFISLFKDTTLVAIVGLLDLLGIAKAVVGQKEFIGLHKEVYAFVAVIFFICCFAMSYASRRLEQTLGVGER